MDKRKQLIIATESGDVSTNKVIEWLHFFSIKFIRKNVDTDFTNFSLKISNQAIQNSVHDNLVWNRRGYLPIIPQELKGTGWIDYLKKEQLIVLKAFEDNNKNYIGSYFQELDNNKVLNLQAAAKVQFKIPSTLITNNRFELFNFITQDKRYITKSLFLQPTLETDEFVFLSKGTSELSLEEIPSRFAPSLVQEYIEKEVEIRVFVFEKSFYSMAIFSQNDEQTKLDYRNYNHVKPNRNVPFQLPKIVLNKLKKLLKILNCDTASIDLILTPDDEFVFLEINPMGQYDWLSQSCNYYIDKSIAQGLLRKLNNERKFTGKTSA